MNTQLTSNTKAIRTHVRKAFKIFHEYAELEHDCSSTCPFINECKSMKESLCMVITGDRSMKRLEKPYEDPRQLKIFEEDK